jgi:nucleoside-diphosphate-sugar epimerase
LMEAGHTVHVWDIGWFCDLPGNVRRDIRDPIALPTGTDAIIHLAAVANDPTGDLDPQLTWEINALATEQLASAAVMSGVKQFIYASSGSVYGVSDEPHVTEDCPLVPLTAYNKTKRVAERILMSYANRMTVQILRPATVCGYSPRMRLDVAVNMLTMQALTKGVVTVLGGEQMRPHVHIEDMASAYLWMLDHPWLLGIYNVGFENLSIAELAKTIADRTGARLEIKPSNDPRSYRLNSDRLRATGFRPEHTVSEAISEVIDKFHDGTLKDEERWYNLRWMTREQRKAA